MFDRCGVMIGAVREKGQSPSVGNDRECGDTVRGVDQEEGGLTVKYMRLSFQV